MAMKEAEKIAKNAEAERARQAEEDRKILAAADEAREEEEAIPDWGISPEEETEARMAQKRRELEEAAKDLQEVEEVQEAE